MINFFRKLNYQAHLSQKVLRILANDGCFIKYVETIPDNLSDYQGMYLFTGDQLVFVKSEIQKVEVNLTRCQLIRLQENYNQLEIYQRMQTRYALGLTTHQEVVLFDKLLVDKNSYTWRPLKEGEVNLTLFQNLYPDIFYDLSTENEQYISEDRLEYMSPFSQRLNTIRSVTQQDTAYTIVNAKQVKALNLVHHLNIKKLNKERILKELMPYAYHFLDYPFLLKQLCSFLNLIVNYATIILKGALAIVQFSINLVSLLPRLLETLLLIKATQLRSPRDMGNGIITDEYRPLKRELLVRKEVTDSDIMLAPDASTEQLFSAILTLQVSNPNAFLLTLIKFVFYEIAVGFEIDVNHISVVIQALFKTWTQGDLSIKERILQIAFFIIALPLTLVHSTLGLSFEFSEILINLLKASLSLTINLPGIVHQLSFPENNDANLANAGIPLP